MHRLASLVVLAAVGLTIACAKDGPTSPPPKTGNGAKLSTNLSNGPQNSEQVVFSGVATSGSTFGSPVGFWIWCEADSNNPYVEECNGAMYFYTLGITRHVEGEIAEGPDGLYTMTVSSTRDGAIVDCKLSNPDQAVQGPNNHVHVDCTTPHGHADAFGALVNVTGP